MDVSGLFSSLYGDMTGKPGGLEQVNRLPLWAESCRWGFSEVAIQFDVQSCHGVLRSKKCRLNTASEISNRVVRVSLRVLSDV
jgi:hypothetical protein